MERKITMEILTWDKKRLFIESIIAIVCAGMGVIFGRSSNTYYYNGQEITETEMNKIMKEIEEYKSNYETLLSENEEQKLELSKLNEQISLIPTIQFQDVGLIIHCEEQVINKNRSMVTIEGNQYYSKDFINSLLEESDSLTIKNNTVYVGRIISDKSDLFDKFIMDKANCNIQNSAIDSFGKTYSNILYMDTSHSSYHYITYVLDRKYSLFKFSVAVSNAARMGNKGILTVKADDQVVYTSKPIDKQTPLFTELDIPLNNCTLLTIEYNSEGGCACIITNAEVYN